MSLDPLEMADALEARNLRFGKVTARPELENASWEELFKARAGLSTKQVETLSIVCGRGHILVADIAFDLCTSPSAAGRTVAILCRKGLVYEDYIGRGTKNHITLSLEGRKWIKDHKVPV